MSFLPFWWLKFLSCKFCVAEKFFIFHTVSSTMMSGSCLPFRRRRKKLWLKVYMMVGSSSNMALFAREKTMPLLPHSVEISKIHPRKFFSKMSWNQFIHYCRRNYAVKLVLRNISSESKICVFLHCVLPPPPSSSSPSLRVLRFSCIDLGKKKM